MRKIHSLGLVGAVALVLAAVVAPAANGAVTRVETDQFSGVASAQALDLSLLGRRLTFGIASADSAANVVTNSLNQKASGIGTLLSPKTAITAAQGETPSDGGRACFQPPLGEALNGAGLPALLIGEAACGEASTKGDVSSFEAIGTGTVASLRLNATQILKPALDALKPVLDTVAATPVGDLLKATDAPAKTAVTTLNGLLGSLLGNGGVVLPTLEPSQTVKDVVEPARGLRPPAGQHRQRHRQEHRHGDELHLRVARPGRHDRGSARLPGSRPPAAPQDHDRRVRRLRHLRP